MNAVSVACVFHNCYTSVLDCNFWIASITIICLCCPLSFFYHSNSIAEGDSDDEDDDGDLILENDCLTPYDSHRVTNSNNTNLYRDSPTNRPHHSTAVRPLPQSISLPNSVGASLTDSSAMMMSSHNGNTASSSQESMREDGNIITL